MAIGTGTDIAIEAADVVLMSGDLAKVPAAVELSRATMRNIAQNLFWAFGYNMVLIPVAAGALYPVNGTLLSPMFGAGAMAFSSFLVVTNALRLRRFNPATIEPLASDLREAEVLRAAREMDTSTIFEVQGMTCGNCVNRVTEAVRAVLPGVEVNTDLSSGTVEISPSPPDPAAVAKAILETGYPTHVAA